MSTYSPSLVSPGTFSSGEGPEVTTQPRTLPQVKRKRRRYNKKRGHRQTRKNTLLTDYVIQTMTNQPTDGPKLYSIAGSTIATFSEAHVAAMRWKNEVRPRITAEVDGQKIDLLYDTGAQTSCLTKDTVRQLFPPRSCKLPRPNVERLETST